MADGTPTKPDDKGLRLRIGGAAFLTPADAARAAGWLADLGRRAAEAGCDRLARFAGGDPSATVDAGRLGAVLDLSPHLNAIMLRRPEWLEQLFSIDARERIGGIAADVRTLPGEGATEASMMRALREAKLETALLVALRELFGAAGGRETTADLSDLAEAAVAAALRFALVDLHARRKLALPDTSRPETGCGLFVLGMGKLGGGELNYSSDIDLIVFFDPDAAAIRDPAESVEMFSKLVRRLVRIIGERTGDGYVFRTDLRLRPDPGAMPLAIPVAAAVAYYEASGRNWERAAMIKARCVAGDRAAAADFLDELTPFVWRRYLDFATVAEIRSMKHRIDRHRCFEGLGVGGHNVKLGPGGIREIEFFAQAQQLIAGGRSPALRLRRTEEALAALAADGWIGADAAAELIEAYWFLRRVEHAIQMVADEQSHTVPETPEGLARVAGLSGFADVASFSEALLRRLAAVERRFSHLFSGREEAPGATGDLGSLLLGEDDAAASERLAALGFRRPGDMARILRGWSAGRIRATRSEAARRHFTAILPQLVETVALARDPDAALVAFDAFLGGLPAGLQFFSIIASNPRILDLLALIITAAPRLAETIAHRPHVFDALLDPAFFHEVPGRDLLRKRLAEFLREADGYEDTLVRLRLFSSEQQFLVGARLLSGAVEGEDAGAAYSLIAETVVAEALAAVERHFAARHGRVAGGRLALLGLGRLGSGELTAGSDVDLILLFDHDEGAEDSDDGAPLAPSLYYARLTQRLIAALAAPMGEGVLYEVDFRLRPSGNKGPLATHIDAFRRYQSREARTWERMALTRSRPIAGDPSLVAEVEETIREVLAVRRDAGALRADVASMRARIEREKPARGPLDVKLRPGGLIDLEFIAAWAILSGRVPPDRIGRPTAEALAALEASSALTIGNPALSLRSSAERYTRIIQLMRLGPGGAHSLRALPQGLADRIAEALGLADAAGVETAVDELAAATREAFERLLSPDAP